MARRHLYIAHMHLAQRAGEAGDFATLSGILDRYRHPSGDEDLRGFEWYYWDRRCAKLVVTIPSHELVWDKIGTRGLLNPVTDLQFSPNGESLAKVDAFGLTTICDATSGREIARLGVGAMPLSVADSMQNSGDWILDYSPDGSRLAVASNSAVAVTVWNIESGKQVAAFTDSTEGRSHGFSSVAFSPDGTRLAAGHDDNAGKVTIWDTASGEKLKCLEVEQSPRGLTFSPDSKKLAWGDSDGKVHVWDVDAGTEVWCREKHERQVESVAFSPDGTLLASGGLRMSVPDVYEADTVQVANALTGDSILSLGIPTGRSMLRIFFDSTGKRLAAAFGNGILNVWEIGLSNGAVPLSADLIAIHEKLQTTHDHYFTTDLVLTRLFDVAYPSVAFSWDWKRLASVRDDETVAKWGGINGRDAVPITKSPGYMAPGTSFTTDGKSLAVGDSLIDVASGEQTVEACIALSANGSRIAVSNGKGGIIIKDVASRRTILDLKVETTDERMIAFSHDGSQIARSDFQRLELWQVDSGAKIELGPSSDFVFRPMYKQIAILGADGTIAIYRYRKRHQHTVAAFSRRSSPYGILQRRRHEVGLQSLGRRVEHNSSLRYDRLQTAI